MGGIPTKEVKCSMYDSAENVDKDFEMYINEGILVDGEYMYFYSWHSFWMYVYNLNIQSYINTMGAILDCGLSNSVEGSKYANADYYEKVWKVTRAAMQMELFDALDLWWFPLMFPLYYILPFSVYFLIIALWWVPVVGYTLGILTPTIATSGVWGTTLNNII